LHEKTKYLRKFNSIFLNRNIRFCEAALVEILETLRKNLKEPEINMVKSTDEEYFECLSKTQNRGQRCQDCINCYYFNFLSVYLQRNNEALIQSTKFTFDFIKKRLQQNNKYMGGQVIKEKLKNPLFQGDIILAIPNITVKPTLDDMQTHLNKVFLTILKISQDLPEWRHSIKIREMQIKVWHYIFFTSR
jgi:dynein heavy chain